MRCKLVVSVAALAAACVLPMHSGAAQQPEQLYMSRAELESLLEFYDQSVASPAYGERLKARALLRGGVVRSRLENGDFQVGDEVVVELEGVTPLQDTLIVEQGRILRFPELGQVELEGVLRSELAPLLEGFVGRYVREPRIRSTPLIRLQLSGSVANPGFYRIPSETPLDVAIMQAGGPAGDVDLSGIVIERRGQRILSGDAVQDALAEGRTLDQLNLQGGDRVVIPIRFPLANTYDAVRTFSLILTLPLSVAALIALFN